MQFGVKIQENRYCIRHYLNTELLLTRRNYKYIWFYEKVNVEESGSQTSCENVNYFKSSNNVLLGFICNGGSVTECYKGVGDLMLRVTRKKCDNNYIKRIKYNSKARPQKNINLNGGKFCPTFFLNQQTTHSPVSHPL